MEDSDVKEIPDIERNNFCFTDGTGNISSDLCHKINEYYGLKFCAAYQIRLAGFKGVLMRKNIMPDGVKIQYRPSMRKFDGKGQLELGIIRCATYSPAYLNRQLIMLLSCLGVPDEIFLEKLN